MLLSGRIAERKAFSAYDAQANVRTTFVAALKKQFPDWGLRFSIGGEISFDVFPEGWDKTYALRRLADEAKAKGAGATTDQDIVPGWDLVHFFGDKTYEVSAAAAIRCAIPLTISAHEKSTIGGQRLRDLHGQPHRRAFRARAQRHAQASPRTLRLGSAKSMTVLYSLSPAHPCPYL